MKKTLCVLFAVLFAATLSCAAFAEDAVPQPEAGKKFEGSWALRGGLITIDYEEEGYRVCVDLCNSQEQTGTLWEYSCYYQEASDTLVSVTSLKRDYTIDSFGNRAEGENEYEGLDEEGLETVFAVKENGALSWTSGRDQGISLDLEFRPIGSFAGMWKSAEGEEPVWVEFTWHGLDEETYFYSAYLHRGDDTAYTEYTLTGAYDEETGKLVLTGEKVEGANGETYEAVFSMIGNDRLLYEAANGIILEFDPLGVSNG